MPQTSLSSTWSRAPPGSRSGSGSARTSMPACGAGKTAALIVRGVTIEGRSPPCPAGHCARVSSILDCLHQDNRSRKALSPNESLGDRDRSRHPARGHATRARLRRSGVVRAPGRACPRQELARGPGRVRARRVRARRTRSCCSRDCSTSRSPHARSRRARSTALERLHAPGRTGRAERGGVEPALRCRYHGRRFGLDGRFLSMPEFEQASRTSPSAADDLAARARSARGGQFLFASVDPATPLRGGRGAGRGRCAAGCRSSGRGSIPRARATTTVPRQLGALLRQLSRGLPHPLRARRRSPRRSTIGELPYRDLRPAEPAGRHRDARASPPSLVPPAGSPTTASGSPATTSGSSRPRCSTSIPGACR